MQQTKLNRSEVVRRAYDIASFTLTERAQDGTITEKLLDEGMSEEDIARIESEIRKIGERLQRHTYTSLKGVS